MRAYSNCLAVVLAAVGLAILATGCGGTTRAAAGGQQPTTGETTNTTSEWTFTVDPNAVRVVAPPPPRFVTRQAITIARHNPSLRALLARAPLRVNQSGNWTSVTDGHRLGANLVVRLPHPISVDADLPYVSIPPDTPAGQRCPHPYARGWIHERSSNVDELGVLVDVRRRAVVAIDTNARSGVRSWVPGRPHPRCSG